jgi:hypothetical protein
MHGLDRSAIDVVGGLFGVDPTAIMADIDALRSWHQGSGGRLVPLASLVERHRWNEDRVSVYIAMISRISSSRA